MTFLKIMITSAMVLFLSLTGFSQSEKMMAKAADRVEQLNAELTAADLALTDDQKEQLTKLEARKMAGMKKIRKSDASEADQKAEKKALRKEIKKEEAQILTKAQRQMKKTINKNKKSEE